MVIFLRVYKILKNYWLRYGYTKRTDKRYTVKPSFFETLKFDEEFTNRKNANEKINLFSNENHTVVVSNDGAFIYTNEESKHLKQVKPALKFINNHILNETNVKFYGVSYETTTMDYIKKIENVERYAKDLRIDRKIVQKYNRERTKYDYNKKYSEFEHYSSEFQSNYYTEEGYCSRKSVQFTNSEYYDDTIGTLSTIIQVKMLYGDLNGLSILDIYPTIEKLEEKSFNIFKDCFTEEYLETLT